MSIQIEAKNLGFAADAIHRVLENDRVVVLLDGLDEIPTLEQKNFVRNAVAAFAQTVSRTTKQWPKLDRCYIDRLVGHGLYDWANVLHFCLILSIRPRVRQLVNIARIDDGQLYDLWPPLSRHA